MGPVAADEVTECEMDDLDEDTAECGSPGNELVELAAA